MKNKKIPWHHLGSKKTEQAEHYRCRNSKLKLCLKHLSWKWWNFKDLSIAGVFKDTEIRNERTQYCKIPSYNHQTFGRKMQIVELGLDSCAHHYKSTWNSWKEPNEKEVKIQEIIQQYWGELGNNLQTCCHFNSCVRY